MTALELNSQEEFRRAILHGVSVVDFNAYWCGPCRAQEPVLDALSETYAGKVTVAKLDIDENRPIAMDMDIQSIPTIVIFKNGREINRFVGYQAMETLDEAIKYVLA
jgi:thioredoxin 1